MKNKEYKNIACSLYDEYVLLAMHHTVLELSDTKEMVKIEDIFTSEKQEFIRCSNGRVLRLDAFEITENQIVIKN